MIIRRDSWHIYKLENGKYKMEKHFVRSNLEKNFLKNTAVFLEEFSIAYQIQITPYSFEKIKEIIRVLNELEGSDF